MQIIFFPESINLIRVEGKVNCYNPGQYSLLNFPWRNNSRCISQVCRLSYETQGIEKQKLVIKSRKCKISIW